MEYTVKAEETGRRVRDILRRSMGVSYTAMKSAKWNDRIRLNGEPVHADATVSAGDLVSMDWAEDAPVYTIKPFDLPLEVPYLDEDIILCDEDEADKAYTDKTYNTLVSYTVSAGTWSYKMLLEADTDTVYYIHKHKVNARNAPGFLPEDLKRISRKR